MDDGAALARLIDAMRPWLEKVVFVGGWAHRLHRFHPDATVPSYQPIVTRDVDIAFDDNARMTGNIANALKTAGFSENLSGENVPPVSHYTFGIEDQGFYAEFLAPLKGSGMRRDGTEDATAIVAGVSAQKLRHLEVLLVAPWTLQLTPSALIPISEATTVFVANPVSYIVQKLLIHAERKGNKKAQDILYLNDTLELFSGHMDTLRTCWLEEVRPTLSQKQGREVVSATENTFGVITDSIRDAARIPTERAISPEEIRIRCSVGLRELLA